MAEVAEEAAAEVVTAEVVKENLLNWWVKYSDI